LVATEAQMQAIQEAKDIDSGVDTRTKKEMLAEQMTDLKSIGKTVKEEGPMFLAESTPGVGEAIAIKRTSDALDEKDYLGATIEAGAGLLGVMPVFGDAAAKGLRSTKSELRKLFDKLPETERASLPAQPDENRIFGYHGTAKARSRDEPFFDINFARKNDQFLGEGFYFTLDPEIASEYASLRSIGRNFEKTIKGDAARKILTAPNVQKQFVGGLGKDVSVHVTPGGDYVTVGSIMKGKNIYGEDIAAGQQVGRFDLSELQKPYVVRTEKQRKELKDKIPELKEQGYDSVLFADFKDRSKQIMVFPEHMDKIDTSSIAGRSASVSLKEADALEIGINPAMKDGALLRKYDASTVNSMVENASAANAGTKAANKLIGAEVPDGTQVGIRLNLNSTIPNMPRGLDKLQTLHQKNYNGKALSYRPFATVENVTFNVNQKGRQGIAAKIKGVDVPEAKNKFPAMSVDGQLNNSRNILDEMDDDVVEIGFNPMSGHLFVDMSTGQAVQSAEVATVVGDRVYAKGVTYMKKAEAPDPLSASDGTPLPSEVRYKMKKGGVVPMDRQMDMFADGGLEQDGGTNDPVSGNEVPPGSTQEEVRDDIPAQLSEGEFVFPADVVRYIGLEKLMMMRQEAKMGLKMMEAMGQMGNSEEATMPDDLPFDINDLDMDDEPEYNVGGFVPGTQQDQQMGIAGYQAAPMPTTSYATQPVQAASQQFVQPVPRPAQAYVPTQQVPTPLPTFGQITGPGVPEVDFEFATFRNEAGQEIQLRIKKGSKGELLPGEVLPEGYSWVDPAATATEEVTTTPTTVGTTSVRDKYSSDQDSERRREEEEARYGPGGGRIALGGVSDGKGFKNGATIVGVSFDGGGLGLAAALATGKGIPEDVNATFFLDGETVTVSAEVYNRMKEAGFKGDESNFILDRLKNPLETRQRDFAARRAEAMGEEAKREAQKEGTLQNKIAKAQDMEVGSKERRRAFGERDGMSRSGFTEGSIIDQAIRQAQDEEAANIARGYDDEAFSDVSVSQAELDAARQSAPTLSQAQQRDDNESPFENQTSYSIGSGGGSRTTGDDARGGYETGRGFFADGGLAAKKKPKVKKMKRGGLASKK